MKMKSTSLFQWLRRLGYLMGGVFLCLIFIVGGLIWYIQTPEGTQKTLSAADQFLRKNHNGNFTFSNAKINLVHGQLQIENLKANISFNENFQIQIESPLFNFEFSVSELLDHRIFIKNLEIQELKSKIISLENAAESMNQDPKKKNFKIPTLNTYKEKLQNIISKNPISIEIPNLKLSIKEFILIKNKFKTIEIQNANLQSQLHWDDNSFQLNYSTEIKPKGFAQYYSTQSAMGLKENSTFKLNFVQNKSKEIKLHQLEGVLYLLPLKVSSQEIHDIALSFDKQSIGIAIPNFNYKLKNENLKTENSLFNAPVILDSKWTYQFSNLFQDLKIEQILKINNHQVLTFKTTLDLAGIKNNASELQIHINKSISKISSLLKPLIPWADLSVDLRGNIPPLEKALNEPISTLSLEGKIKSGHSQFIFLLDPLDFKLELLLEAQRLQWDLNFSHQKNMNSSFLNFFSAGTYFKNEHRFYASSYIKAHFKKDQNYIKNFDLLGEFQMPFYINFRKNKYEAEGSMVFSNLSINSPQFNFINIKGSIPFKESFELCNKKVCFKNPIASNAFERADFEQIQPLIKSSAPLSIETIKIQNKLIGPFHSYISLFQNQVSIHQFDMDIDEGSLNGEFYLDFIPAQMQMGILTRLSQFNLAKFLNIQEPTPEYLNGRVGLTVDLNKGILNGRLDISEITKKQLLLILKVMDPKYNNDRINQVRSALNFAYPHSLGMSFNNGYTNLDILLKGKIETFIQLRDLPISALLLSKTRTLRNQIKEMPIQ